MKYFLLGMSIFCQFAKAADIEVIQVQRNIAMSESDVVYKDYYLTGGAQAGLKENLVVKVVRNSQVAKNGKVADGIKMNLPIGWLRILYVQPQIAVARLYNPSQLDKNPIVENPGVMIGDRIDLSGSFVDSKKQSPKDSEQISQNSEVDVVRAKESSVAKENAVVKENVFASEVSIDKKVSGTLAVENTNVQASVNAKPTDKTQLSANTTANANTTVNTNSTTNVNPSPNAAVKSNANTDANTHTKSNAKDKDSLNHLSDIKNANEPDLDNLKEDAKGKTKISNAEDVKEKIVPTAENEKKEESSNQLNMTEFKPNEFKAKGVKSGEKKSSESVPAAEAKTDEVKTDLKDHLKSISSNENNQNLKK